MENLANIGYILMLGLGIAISPVPIIVVILILFSDKAKTNGIMANASAIYHHRQLHCGDSGSL